jgi:spermidine synthase
MTDRFVELDGGRWLMLPAHLVSEIGSVYLRESPDCDINELTEALRDGSYTKPFVVDDGALRRLHFSLDFVQSEMSLADPHVLRFAYTRMMMAFLLFLPRVKHVLIVGLGGGSMSKFCYQQLPRARVTTIEIDADVIEFGKLFQLPVADKRARLVHADAAEYLANSDESADVILVDGCDRNGVAPSFCNERFYRDLHARLSPRGMLVMNLIGGGRVLETHLKLVAGTFSGRVMMVTASVGGNRLLFAFKDRKFIPDWTAIQRTAKQLQKDHDLDFPGFAKKLRHSRQFQAVS